MKRKPLKQIPVAISSHCPFTLRPFLQRELLKQNRHKKRYLQASAYLQDSRPQPPSVKQRNPLTRSQPIASPDESVGF
jgi:hypothetical protein